MIEGTMETEFKIPAHPLSDPLFSKHAFTSYTPRMSGGDVGSKFNPSSTCEGGFPHAQKPFSLPRDSVKGSISGRIPCQVKSPKEKHLVKKSPSRSKVPPPLKSTLPQAKTSSLAFLSPATASNAPTPASTPVSSDCSAELQHLASTADVCVDSSAASTSDIFVKPRPVTESTDSAEVEAFQKLFYFESDHLALKANQDYQNLLQTICLLEAQRIKAIDNLDKLLMGQERALEDPIGFVQKLQNKEDLKLPRPQKVPEVPAVNLDNYSGSLAQEMMQGHPHRTRSAGSSAHDGAAERGASLASSSQNAFSVKNSGDKNKSESFNKPWSIDEQKRLEQLLVEFPPEEVEARRWDKIARALGNRTMHQCDSCNCDPIIGPRWHCKECPEEISVDFCSDCVDMNYEDDMHKTSHKMEVVRDVLSHFDKDYTKFVPSGYNYLDPNYMPPHDGHSSSVIMT